MSRSRRALVVMVLLSSSTAFAQPHPMAKGARPSQSPPPSASDSDSVVPPLPDPSVGDDAAPLTYLQAAADALAAGRAAEAQEAMERAESRALDRSVRPSQASVPDGTPLVRQIAAARAALAGGDRGLARLLLQSAILDLQGGDSIK